MTTFAESLKREIARVARKETRGEITALRKTVSSQRTELSALKKLVSELHTQLKRLSKTQTRSATEASTSKVSGAPPAQRAKPGRKVVFTADRLKAQRARLGFTQDQMAKLLGVSSLSIWKWESGGAAPRASRVPQILERIALGKREALAAIDSSGE